MKDNLIHSISLNLTDRLNIYAKKDGLDLQKITLGIEILLINIPKITIIVILSLLLGIPHESLTVLITDFHGKQSTPNSQRN